MSLTEAGLLREVARVQHDKTLQAVRDAIDLIPVTEYDSRSYSNKPLPAEGFRRSLLAALQRMREGADR